MNILSFDLEWEQTMHLIPHAYISLGKSVYVYLNWFNLGFCVKHISTDYKAKSIYFSTPSVTIMQYPSSAYLYTFEINAFGYTYRKGLIRDESKEVSPYDNTPGFVTEEWFSKFGDTSNSDFLKGLEDLIREMKEKLEQQDD